MIDMIIWDDDMTTWPYRDKIGFEIVFLTLFRLYFNQNNHE